MSPGPLNLPADRAAAVQHGTALPDEQTGSVLFADLGGFTEVTHQLVNQLGSRQGAELLINHLNSLYDTIVDEVHRYGGVIVDFQGDAVNCFFNADTRPDAEFRAVTAAVGIQTRLGWHEPLVFGDHSVSMGVKVGIASGTVGRLLVGDPDFRLIDLITGPPVVAAVRLEQRAISGQIIVDRATALAIGNRGVVTPKDGGRQDDFAVESLNERASSCRTTLVGGDDLDHWIDQNLRSLPTDRTAELRTTVAVFVRFLGVDQANQHDPLQLDLMIRTIQSVAAHHGGSVVQVTVGEKDGYAYCAFGAPAAHKEISDRALACALDLRATALGGHLGRWSIGIDQGVCRTGAYGGRTRRTYGVIGDCVNVAARLMAAADAGEILATSRVQSEWNRSVSCEEPRYLALTGQPEPVLTVSVDGYPIVGTEGRTYRSLVGRSSLLASLLDLLIGVVDGTARIIVVQGGAGVGKSHLIEAARVVLLESANVRWMECSADELQSNPLYPFVDLLHRVFYQELSDDPAVRRDLYEAGLSGMVSELSETHPVLAAEVASAKEDLWTLISESASTLKETASKAVVKLLRAMTINHPLVLHIQDGQWIDPQSVAVILELTGTLAEGRLCIVVDTTTGLDTSTCPDASQLQVAALNPLEVQQLAESILGKNVDATVADYLIERSQGNPLYIEHLVADLEARGALAMGAAGTMLFSQVDRSASLPPSLAAVIAARLDRFPTLNREVVQMASVLGETFDLAHLRAMYTSSDRPVDFDLLMTQIEQEGIWTSEGGRASFSHRLVRAAALELYLESDIEERKTLASRVRASDAGRQSDPSNLELRLPSRSGSEKQAMELVAAVAQGIGLPSERIEDLRTAVAEACINAMLHGNRMADDAAVMVSITIEREWILIDVLDENRASGPTPTAASTMPDMAAQIAGTTPTGGMGLAVIGALVDHAEFLQPASDATGTRFRMMMRREGTL